MMDGLLQLVVVLSLALLAYHHVVYPVLLSWIPRLWSSLHTTPPSIPEAALPSITIIVPARNEAAVITGKIENLVALDYPPELLTVVIALDGCTDATLPLAKAALERANPKFSCELVAYPRNIGKVAVLNAQIARAQAEIVALSDASATINPDVLKRAARDFSDPTVGVVVPTYRLTTPGNSAESAYIDYLTNVRRNEAMLRAPLGAHGALYFFRRGLWKPLPADTINDDFILPMEIIAQGYRGVYDAQAIVSEVERTDARQDFRRRVRLGAGNAQQSIRLFRLPGLRRGWLGFMFLSGKGARPLMPVIFIACLLAIAWLAGRGNAAYQVLLIAITLLTVGSLYAIWRSDLDGVWKPLSLIGYMIVGYAAALLGAVRYAAGYRIQNWQPQQHDTRIEADKIWSMVPDTRTFREDRGGPE